MIYVFVCYFLTPQLHVAPKQLQTGSQDFQMMNDANLSTTIDARRFVKGNVDEVSTLHA